MYAFAQDVRLAFLQLRKAPGFTLTIVLTLALGVGATTASFSLVEGILLRPLPLSDPDRLVLLGDHLRSGPNLPVSAPEIGTYSSATRAFSSMGGYITTKYEVSSGATPEEVDAARFTARVFPTLGTHPILGRIVRLVLMSAAKMALLGRGFGVLGSLAVARLVSSLLFHVSTTDPAIYIGCVLIRLLMALLASVLSPTHAASTNPIDALRSN